MINLILINSNFFTLSKHQLFQLPLLFISNSFYIIFFEAFVFFNKLLYYDKFKCNVFKLLHCFRPLAMLVALSGLILFLFCYLFY